MGTVINPFIVGHYVSDDYFCDRQKETAFLMKQIENGRNVALMSPRRLGKSDLIHHLLCQEPICEKYHTFFIDIYATKSLTEFVYLLGKSIFEKLRPGHKVFMEKFFQIISSFRIGFKLDAVSGAPSLDLSLGDIRMPQTSLEEIFRYLESSDMPNVIAIDEFQQIGEYEEKNVEALLRTYIQRCKNTQFIFSGSKRSIMSNMFNSPAKPFYGSSITMELETIPQNVYVSFAQMLFEKNGKNIEQSVINRVYTEYNGCTWFVQMMMNELYALTEKGATCTDEYMPTALMNVIQTQKIVYKEILAKLSQKQKLVIQAIAKEKIVDGITSSAFIKRHNLPSASSVQSAVKTLIDRDVLTVNENKYQIYDYFFAEWIRMEY